MAICYKGTLYSFPSGASCQNALLSQRCFSLLQVRIYIIRDLTPQFKNPLSVAPLATHSKASITNYTRTSLLCPSFKKLGWQSWSRQKVERASTILGKQTLLYLPPSISQYSLSLLGILRKSEDICNFNKH